MLVTFLYRTFRPPLPLTRLRAESGFTLIEVLMAAVVLIVGILGLVGLLDTSVKTSFQTHAREGATSLSREILEDARAIPFPELSPSTIVCELQEMNGLKKTPCSSGSTWQVERGLSGSQQAIAYTVTVKACYIDDPKDGLAKNSELTASEQAAFCQEHKGSEEWTSGAVDSTPIDFKRVSVEVAWTAKGRSPKVQSAEMISSAGEATALSASELKLVPPPEVYPSSSVTQPVITATASELTFSVNVPNGSTAARWSLEGVTQTPAPTLKEGTIWTFKWPIENVSDGTYQVSAQAVTTKGVLGPPVTIPVTLIRKTPAAPKGVKGGFNEVYVGGVHKKAAELEWEANSERNVIGYRVYNPSGLLCPTSTSTLSVALSCIELSTPYTPASAPTYSLAALYRSASGEVLEGAKKSFTLGTPTTVSVPRELKLTKNEDGSVTLTWTPPAEGSPAFYRIYRGSTDYTSRYDTASALPSPSFTDDEASSTHTYWVTAVSSTLTESEFAGPVSG